MKRQTQKHRSGLVGGWTRSYLLVLLAVLWVWLQPTALLADSSDTPDSMTSFFPAPIDMELETEYESTPAIPVVAFPQPPERDTPPILLEPEFETHHPELLQQLLQRTEPHVTWRLTAVSPSADTRIISDGALVAGPPDSLMQTRTLTDWHYRIRFIHERPWDKSKYGIEYRYDGSAKDQDRFELWSRWTFGISQLTTSIARLETNVSKVASQPSTSTIQSKIGLEMVVPEWPRLELSYTRAFARSSVDPLSPGQPQRLLDTVKLSLDYYGSNWEVIATSTYESTRNLQAKTQESMKWHQGLSLAYHLTPELTISPSMTYTYERSPTPQHRTQTTSLDLAVIWNQWLRNIDITAKSSYEWRQGPKRRLETRKFTATGSMIGHVKNFWLGAAQVSLDVSYVRFYDAITAANSYASITGGISLRLQFS